MSSTDFGGVIVHDATTGVGYGTGAGGTVIQVTNKSTSVTLNTASGAITMNNAALANATAVAFTLTNSAIAATDTVSVGVKSGSAAATSYIVGVMATAAGSCSINVYNCSGASASDAIVLNFNVLKGATS